MTVRDVGLCGGSSDDFSLLDDAWSVCLPCVTSVDITVEGKGPKIKSWEATLRLKGDFTSSVQHSALRIKIEGKSCDARVKVAIEGDFKLIPKCGGFGHMRISGGGGTGGSKDKLFLFIRSGGIAEPQDDAFVFERLRAAPLGRVQRVLQGSCQARGRTEGR